MKKRMLACVLSACVIMTLFAVLTIGNVSASNGALMNALTETSKWGIYGFDTLAEVSTHSKLSITTPEASNTLVGYSGDFVKNGEKMSFDIRYTDKVDGGWTTLQFRADHPTAGYTSEFDGASGYTLFITSAYIAISNGTQPFDQRPGVGPAPGSYAMVNLFDGKVHTLDVTITDETAGTKIDVVLDGATTMSFTDKEKLFAATRTGFGIHDYLQGTFEIADKGNLSNPPPAPGETTTAKPTVSPNAGPVEKAAFDKDNWSFYNSHEGFKDGMISFNNGVDTTYRIMGYKGDFVQSGVPMEFEFQYEDKHDADWTALQFRTNKSGWIDFVTANAYSVWICSNSVRISIGATVMNSIANVTPFDGKIHDLSVTITDTADGVVIDVVFDGQTMRWIDEDSFFTGAGYTGFCVEDYAANAESVLKFTLADKGKLSGETETTTTTNGDTDTTTSVAGATTTTITTTTGTQTDNKNPDTGVALPAVALLSLVTAGATALVSRKRK